MSFREKSAWLMAGVLGLAGAVYVWLAQSVVEATGTAAPGPAVIPFVLLVIAASVVVQVVLAVSAPREAMRAADERERAAQGRAAILSGLVLGAGIVCSLGAYVVRPDGNTLFHFVLVSLIVAQIVDYAAQIILFRRGA